MPSARPAAIIFGLTVAIVALFQVGLALGAPWGKLAMGGAYPGVYPAPMRVAALAQLLIYAAMAAIVSARAGLILGRWRRPSRILVWLVVGVGLLSLVLNLITPSPMERLLWAPVALVLFFTSLRVALSP